METAGLLRLNKKDNVLIAIRDLSPDKIKISPFGSINIKDSVMLGHKIAGISIKKGEKIFKYGVSIGSATYDIELGTHIHAHNMKSDYTATHLLKETAKG